MMDLGDDDDDSVHSAPFARVSLKAEPASTSFDAMQGTKRPRVSFPDHPGPVVPLVASQAFEMPVSPAMGGTRMSLELLNKVYHFQSTQRQNLDKLRLAQWQILSRPSPEAVSALMSQETQMENDTQSALRALVHLWCNWMMTPMEIWRWEFLWLDLHIQLEQIRLYLNEVRNDGGPLCAIAIISHPFPTVATRGRTVDGAAIVVQLLTGATVDLLEAGPVRAEAVIPKGTKGKLQADLMENNSASLLAETRHAEFKLKFANGTRKQPVQFQFRVQVSANRPGGVQRFEVRSAVTPPTISVTNEVQWEEAEGILIERVAFQYGNLCTWQSLCNHLQRHLIHATRQNVLQLQRIFSLAEFSYFQKVFFQNQSVTMENFQEFWKWYGKATHKIRYSKNVLSLFLGGYLFGFIAKSDMELALSGRPHGTFMIRFSERNAGSFSIAYVTQDPNSNGGASMIRHYLVSHEDITQRKSLADFIGESPALTHFLRYIPSSGFNLVASPLGPSVEYELQEKHSALRDFYAKRDPIQHTSGYDSQLNPQPPAHVFQRNLEDSKYMDGQSVLGHGLGSDAGSVSPSLGRIFGDRSGSGAGGGGGPLDMDSGVDNCWDAE